MKTLKAFLILSSLLFSLYACKKQSKTTPDPVAGKWNIVRVLTNGVNYTGQPGDYFDFTANGILDTKKGTSLGTLNYTTDTDSSITITFPGNTGALAERGRITTSTAHSLVIDGFYPVSPGGPNTQGNSITLSR
jgi:hypothetical protein